MNNENQIISQIISIDEIVKLTKEHFPSKKFKSGQAYTIVHTVNAFVNERKKNVVIQAPTGTGKTFIGITVDRVMKKLAELGYISLDDGSDKFETMYTTTTITLQEQYKNEFTYLSNIKSKRNYPCNVDSSGETYFKNEKCIKNLLSGKCHIKDCPYFIARNKFISNPASKLTNSAFMLTAPINLLSSKTYKEDDEEFTYPLDLLVIDECHELPEQIINNKSVEFSINSIGSGLMGKNSSIGHGDKLFITQTKTVLQNIINDIRLIQKTQGYINSVDFLHQYNSKLSELYTLADTYIEIVNNAIKETSKNGGNAQSANIDFKLMSMYEMVIELLIKLKIFANNCNSKNKWVMTETPSGSTDITFKIMPMFAFSELSKKSFHEKSEYKLFMSATIPNIEVFCHELGLNLNNTKYIELPSNIPVERRPLIYASNSVNNKKGFDTSQMIKLIDDIIFNHTIHDDEFNSHNCAIHTASYISAKEIIEKSTFRHRMVLLDTQEKKDEYLERMKTQKGIIIVSPSISTGVNLIYDIARYQIITKVPYLNLGDKYVYEKSKDDPVWYAMSAILTLIQATGRISRTDNDYGKTYIIDSNFKVLLRKYRELFPSWYLDSLQVATIKRKEVNKK